MEQPRHLLTVWNPSYTDDAMDAHLRILLGWAEKARAGKEDEDDVYVWWAKLRSKNRTGPLPHSEEVLAISEQVKQGVETHLYLTDYRSLYVGHIGEITEEDVPGETSGEWEHMPEYIRGHPSNFWFQLWDIRRIISDDTPATIDELKKLRNTRYHDRPVSLYGGIVELPLIVYQETSRSWFSGGEALLDGQLWAERDAEHRAGADRMARELRENLFGRDIWAAMEPGSRSFLTSAETVFRERKDEPGFDFSGPAVGYAKAVETELNALIFPALKKAMKGKAQHDREVLLEGRQLDLGGEVSHKSIGTLLHLLENTDGVGKALRATLSSADGKWVTGVLPRQLGKLREIRNPAAHSGSVDAGDLSSIREELLGVGQEGVIPRVVRARLRAGGG
jgi:hypothetical protein